MVEAIRSLCLKFPTKYRALMAFLSSVLREEGGFEFKKSIVASIVALIQARGGGAKQAARGPSLRLHFWWLRACGKGRQDRSLRPLSSLAFARFSAL